MGAKVIVQDPRITPIARTCDLYLPVRPGPRRGAVRRRARHDDRARLDRSRVHRRAHGRLRRGRRVLQAVAARAHRRGHRRPRAVARARPPSCGAPRRRASCSTRAASSTTPTACRTRSARSTSCSRPAASASRRAATARSSARRTARADASTARSAISCPAGATSPTPSTASTSRACGRSTRRTCPGPGVDAYELFRKIDAGEIKGLLVDLLQPEGLAARQPVRHARAREARVLRRDRLLPERHRAPRRHRAAGQPAGRGRRHGDAGRRPRHQDQQGGRVPGRGAAGLAHHPGPRARARPPARLHVRRARARSSRSCGSRARAASPTTRASPTRRSSSRWACSGRATARSADRRADARSPGTPRLFEPGSYNPVAKGAGPFYFPDGKARFNVADYRPAGRRRIARSIRSS